MKSILFVIPEYHNSFFIKDELRKKGWTADVYIPFNYPEKLLYRKDGYNFTIFNIIKNVRIRYFFAGLATYIFFIWAMIRYKYFLVYGSVDFCPMPWEYYFNKQRPFRLYLFLLKLFKRKIIRVSSGCNSIDTKANIGKIENGNLCNNCGWADGACKDKININRFAMMKRYVDVFLGGIEMQPSTQYDPVFIKYRALDLNLWKPNMEIPKVFELPKTNKLRIMHSFFKTNREHNNKNIKGSPYVIAAIEKLIAEGFNVEYLYITDMEPKNIRFYQVQADIIVDQLYYGWWGSTGMEAMALGKPTVCYLRQSWKDLFFKTFKEYNHLPIVEANTSDIYEVLKQLVIDKQYRQLKGEESRKFAESYFNSETNSIELIKLLEKCVD